MNDNDTTTAKTKKRHGSAKRPNRIEIPFSDEEFARVNELTAAAGYRKPTDFLRDLLLGEGIVKAVLTVEERKSITDLSKIGTNIWQIRKILFNNGLNEKAISDIETMYEEFAEIKNYFKAKLQK